MLTYQLFPSQFHSAKNLSNQQFHNLFWGEKTPKYNVTLKWKMQVGNADTKEEAMKHARAQLEEDLDNEDLSNPHYWIVTKAS